MPRSIPNYLTVDPVTGAVGADFTGHVHAKGIDLDALGPSNDNQIRWLDNLNLVRGSMRTTSQIMQLAHNDAGENASEQIVFTGSGGGGPAHTGQIQLYVGTAPNTKFANLLDSNGKSDFMRALGTQKIQGLVNGYAGPITTTLNPIPRDGSSTQFMTMTVTPPVDAWWLTTMTVGLVQKNDAAYHYVVFALTLNVADMDGQGASNTYCVQHAAVNYYESYVVSPLWRLAAGVTYTVSGMIIPGGGSWSYYMGPDYLHMHGILWQQ